MPLVNSCIKNVWPLIMIEWKTSLAQRPAPDFDFSFGHKGEEESSNPGVGGLIYLLVFLFFILRVNEKDGCGTVGAKK